MCDAFSRRGGLGCPRGVVAPCGRWMRPLGVQYCMCCRMSASPCSLVDVWVIIRCDRHSERSSISIGRKIRVATGARAAAMKLAKNGCCSSRVGAVAMRSSNWGVMARMSSRALVMAVMAPAFWSIAFGLRMAVRRSGGSGFAVEATRLRCSQGGRENSVGRRVPSTKSVGTTIGISWVVFGH